MNRNQFISYLENPTTLSASDSASLADLLRSFPYFQTAHLLYAKSLHTTQSIHYNNQLKITAAYATDRKVLHNLITNDKHTHTKKEFVFAPKEINAEVEKEQFISAAVDETALIAITTVEGVAEKAAKAIAEGRREEPSITTEDDTETPELEKEYLSTAADALVEIELLNEELIYPTEKERKEATLPTEIIAISDKEHVAEEEKISEEENLSFADWLKSIGNTGETVNATSPKKTNDFDLIDKFINEEPKISRTKTEFFNPVNKAKQSVADDITFVSETLAKIYELQGNYNKALQAFENLHLKYPEKRLYFAAQIKKLKKLIQQQNNK